MGLKEAKKNTKQYFCNSVIPNAVTSLFIQKAALHLHTFQISRLLKQVTVQRWEFRPSNKTTNVNQTQMYSWRDKYFLY
jgi:hypothetical protein